MYSLLEPVDLNLRPFILEARRALVATTLSAGAAYHAWLGPGKSEPALLLLSYVGLFVLIARWERKNRYKRVLPQRWRTVISLPAVVFLGLYLYKAFTVVPIELWSDAVMQFSLPLLLYLKENA